MATMTFEEFQASGRDCDDLGAELTDEYWGEEPAHGRIYLDALYIERTDTRPWGARGAYQWYLLIGRNEWFGPLVDLERHLYQFAVAEEYCEK